MKNKKDNIVLITLIVVNMVITAGVIGLIFAKKSQAPADKTSGWQIYKNEKYGFEFKYPKEWLARGYDATTEDDYTLHSIGIGDAASISGGMRWGIDIYGSHGDINTLMEEIIAKTGSQFNDRQERRGDTILGGEQAIMVTVTTNSFNDWINEKIIFKRNNELIVIGNGSVKDNLFDLFISTFKFVK